MSMQALSLQQMLPYAYGDISYLDRALTAGDTESNDREGHRGLAQVGDALMRFIILCEGLSHGLSRKHQQDSLSALSSKDECAKLARRVGIDRLIKCSPRQWHVAPQPVVLKNALSAIVATAYYDSGSIETAFQVMASLGIVNRAQHCVCPQDLTQTGLTSPNNSYIDAMDATEAENAREGADVEEWEMLFQFDPSQLRLEDRPSSPSKITPSVDCDQPQATTDQRISPNQEASIAPATISFISTGPAFDDRSHQHSVQASCSNNSLQTSNSEKSQKKFLHTQSRSSVIKECVKDTSIEERRRAGKPSNSNQIKLNKNEYQAATMCAVNSRCIMFVDAEVAKGAGKHEELESYVSDYAAAICSAGALKSDVLVKTALEIGNSGAILTLRQAVESVRSKQLADVDLVSRPRSLEERLAAIRHLDLRMAQFRIARRLHIYHLYLEAEAEFGRQESDGFVFVTPSSNETSQGSKKFGNPRNERKAKVTDGMIDRGCSYVMSEKEIARRRESVSRLRRFGQRLKELKDKFGLGVFAILPDDLDENIVRNVSDRAFIKFINVVDQFDGPMIRCLSSAAGLIIQFLDDGVNQNITFKIETVSSEDINGLARGSSSMQELFQPI